MPRWPLSKMVPPGVSYMPRDFMPTKRFSTRSSRPIPLARPSSLSRPSSVAGDSFLPSIGTASARVGTAERVEPPEQRRRRELLAVDRDRVAALEIDRDVGRLVGRILGVD